MPPRNRTLDLPVAVNESISLDLDPLPPAEDIQVFLEALAYERPPSRYWSRLASQLYFEDRVPEAIQVCSQGVQVLASHKPAETIPLRALLASFALKNAKAAPKLILNDARYQRLVNKQPKEAFYKEFTATQQQANSLDPKHHVNQLSRAIHLTTTGQNDGALVLFDAILNQHPRHALALLGKACVLLRKRQFAPALKLYQQALEVSMLVQAQADKDGENAKTLGWRGPDPRVGIGLCLWGLGHHDAARKAWKRAAQLNPKNAAAHLLLGISSLNLVKQTARLVPGTFGAHVERSEEEARELAFTEGMSSIQESWKLDKSNATAAVVMAEYFINNAAQAKNQPGPPAEAERAAMAHYNTALKLGEHAIQFAETRIGANHAQLIYARASHLASQLSINATQPELRLLAQRYYGRVVDDVTRMLPSANSSNSAQLHLFLSLATLGLAQCQVANRVPLAAINTLDALTSKPTSSASATQTIELSLLAASLRAQSHPGATASERQEDAERARIILDRALRLIDAAKLDAYGPQSLIAQPDEFPSVSSAHTSAATADAAADVPAALAKASLSIRTEDLSKTALEAIASLGSDPLTRVEFAELLQTEDLARATTAYAEGLELAKAKAGARGKNVDAIEDEKTATNVALIASLETCLGAVLAIRAMDLPNNDTQREEERSWLLQRAIARLESAVTASANAVNTLNASAATAPATPARLEAQRTVDAVKLIASYNLGRANEAADNIDAAREAYQALLRGHPEYTDAKVRLAILNVSKAPASAPGPDHVAEIKALRNTTEVLLREALSSDAGNLDTRSTYVCFLAGEFPGSPVPQWAAIKEFTAQLFGATDAALQAKFGGPAAAKAAVDSGRRDPHTLAALGWAYYQLAVHAAGATAKADRSKNMMRATDLMDKALGADPRCAFAAQGMAILLAEDAFAETAGGTSLTLPATLGGAPEERRKKNADEALAILSKLREVRDEGSVHVCIGHVLMQKDEFERAHKSYELASKRFFNGANAAVIQYVARAEYAIGMKSKSFASLQSSMAHLEEARQLVIKERGVEHPEVRQIEYNFAVTAQKGLQMLFDLQKDRKTAQALRDAIAAVERVQPLLVAPADATAPQDTPMGKEGALIEAAKRGLLLWMTPDVVEQRGKYGASSLLQRAAQALADQESYESEMLKQKEAVAAARKEKELQREQERIRKEEEYRAQIEQMAEKRKALREEAAKIEYLREATPEKEPRRRAKREDVTSGEEDAPDAEKGKKRKRGGGKKKKGKKNLDMVDSDNDESDDAGLFGGGGSGSESSDANDDEDGDEEIIRNGAQLLADEGDAAGATRSGKSSKLSKLAKSKKSSSSKKSKPEGSKKKKRKSLKRAKARDTDEEEDEDDAGGAADSDEDAGGRARKSRKGVFDESSDDEEAAEKQKSSSGGAKRTKKARVTNDMIDSDEEMALLDME